MIWLYLLVSLGAALVAFAAGFRVGATAERRFIARMRLGGIEAWKAAVRKAEREDNEEFTADEQETPSLPGPRRPVR
jgi:hypothetical protein